MLLVVQCISKTKQLGYTLTQNAKCLIKQNSYWCFIGLHLTYKHTSFSRCREDIFSCARLPSNSALSARLVSSDVFICSSWTWRLYISSCDLYVPLLRTSCWCWTKIHIILHNDSSIFKLEFFLTSKKKLLPSHGWRKTYLYSAVKRLWHMAHLDGARSGRNKYWNRY